MVEFSSRITRAFNHANSKFRERMDYSKNLKGTDRPEGCLFSAVLIYPFDLRNGYFGKTTNSESSL